MEENQEKQKPNIPPYPPQYRRKKSNWWIPVVIIAVVILGFFALIGAVLSSFTSGFVNAFEEKPVKLKDVSVLNLDLSNVQEYVNQNPFAAFSGGGSDVQSLSNIITAVERAKDDDKIKGIYYKASLSSPGFVKSQEIREALIDFKKSGKFIYAFIETGSEAQYFNAIVADSIFMPTEGMIELNGYGISSMFMSGFYEKIGMDYYVVGHEDFKSAAESLSRKSFSDSARYQLKVLIEQRYNTLVDEISNSRGMTHDEINSALDEGIYTADKALEKGFIDALMMESDLKDFIKARAFGKEYIADAIAQNEETEEDVKNADKEELNLIAPDKYLRGSTFDESKIYDPDIQIAIINGVGGISSGVAPSSPFDNPYVIKSGQIVKYIKEAREDDKVKAIILRIDSPGGSVIASEEMWAEIVKTRKVKPIYASMSDVAASGGYYMAMACDTIVAHPSTITGSIGVIFAIPNFAGTMDKLDITVDTISTNPSSQFMNVMQPFTEDTKERIYDISKDVYQRFVSKVAESRGKTYEETRALAKGRVWTGRDAKKMGLVDELGGFEFTIDMVKSKLGVPKDKYIYVQQYPKKKDELEAILDMFNIDSPNSGADLSSLKEALGLTPEEMMMNWEVLPENIKSQIRYMLELGKIAKDEQMIMAMPYSIDIR